MRCLGSSIIAGQEVLGSQLQRGLAFSRLIGTLLRRDNSLHYPLLLGRDQYRTVFSVHTRCIFTHATTMIIWNGVCLLISRSRILILNCTQR